MISKKRQSIISESEDAHFVCMIYKNAVSKWGKEKVHSDLTTIWDMRCIMGMHGQIPFGAMECKNLEEVLWVAENILELRRTK